MEEADVLLKQPESLISRVVVELPCQALQQ